MVVVVSGVEEVEVETEVGYLTIIHLMEITRYFSIEIFGK